MHFELSKQIKNKMLWSDKRDEKPHTLKDKRLTKMTFSKVLYTILTVCMVIVCFEAIYAIGWQIESIIKGTEATLFSTFGFVLIASACIFIVIITLFKTKIMEKLDSTFKQGSDTHWLIFTISTGVLIRLLWIITFPSVATSDGASYLALAKQLYETHSYGQAGALAYWPPGYPLLLSIFHSLPVKISTIVYTLNISMYVICSYALYKAIVIFLSHQHARLTIILLMLWPNFIAIAGDTSKESILIALMSCSTYALFKLISEKNHILNSSILGLLLGLIMLVQPSLTLFISVIIATFLTVKIKNSIGITSSLIIIIVSAITIAPWAIRNYSHFNKVVLVSSNGGFNFYRANNENADGRYQDSGPVDLSHLSELDISKKGFELGKEWIVNNPVDFLTLAVKKQLLFLGEDGAAIYSTLKRGGGSDSETTYIIIKTLALIFWMFLWLSILCVSRNRETVTFTFCSYSFLYLYTIHSIFESGSKYHIPVVIFLIILAACAWLPSKEKDYE